jgi:hypothetical protein
MFFLHLREADSSQGLEPLGFAGLDGQAFNKVIHRVAQPFANLRKIKHLQAKAESAPRMGA